MEPLPGFFFSFSRFSALVVSARIGPFSGLIILASVIFDIKETTGSYYSVFVFACEVIFIGFVRKRTPERSILIADSLFWPFVGVPVLYILYRLGQIVSSEVLILVVIKTWLNGLYDAYLAGLIDELRITDIILGFPNKKKKSLTRYLGTRFSLLSLPLLFIGMFLLIGFISSQSSQQLSLRIKYGIVTAEAVNATFLDENLLSTMQKINPYPEGTYLLDCPENRQGWSEPEKLEDNEFCCYETTKKHPLEQWRRRMFFGRLESFPQIIYAIPFESEFKHLFLIYSIIIFLFIFYLYGISFIGYLSIWSLSQGMNRLAQDARQLPERIERGDHIVWSVMNIKELDLLSSEFHSVSGILRNLFRDLNNTNKWLEKEVSRRIEDLQRLTEELRMVLRESENQRENERIRIARELHDEFGQNITGLRMGLFSLERKLAPKADGAVLEKIEEMKELSERLSVEMHRVVASLRPAVLDKIGICEALKQLLEEMSKQGDVKFDFECDISRSISVCEDMRTAIYRISQEALSNAFRHSGSKNIRLNLQTKGNLIILEIEDFGSGMKTGNLTRNDGRVSFGLVGMRERCSVLGGRIEIRSALGKGTLIRAILPSAQEITE